MGVCVERRFANVPRRQETLVGLRALIRYVRAHENI